MLISDWSSDGGSSDLDRYGREQHGRAGEISLAKQVANIDPQCQAAAANILPVQAGVCQYITRKVFTGRAAEIVSHKQVRIENQVAVGRKIGRASCRERVCQYV